MNKLIFVNKNWPNDLRIGCKSSSSLVEFIETNVDLKEEIKEFEATFEKDEVTKFLILDKFFCYNLQIFIFIL